MLITTATGRMKNVLLLLLLFSLLSAKATTEVNTVSPVNFLIFFMNFVHIQIFSPTVFLETIQEVPRSSATKLCCCSFCLFDSLVFPCTITQRTVKNNKIAHVTAVYNLFLCPLPFRLQIPRSSSCCSVCQPPFSSTFLSCVLIHETKCNIFRTY